VGGGREEEERETAFRRGCDRVVYRGLRRLSFDPNIAPTSRRRDGTAICQVGTFGRHRRQLPSGLAERDTPIDAADGARCNRAWRIRMPLFRDGSGEPCCANLKLTVKIEGASQEDQRNPTFSIYEEGGRSRSFPAPLRGFTIGCARVRQRGLWTRSSCAFVFFFCVFCWRCVVKPAQRCFYFRPGLGTTGRGTDRGRWSLFTSHTRRSTGRGLSTSVKSPASSPRFPRSAPRDTSNRKKTSMRLSGALIGRLFYLGKWARRCFFLYSLICRHHRRNSRVVVRKW